MVVSWRSYQGEYVEHCRRLQLANLRRLYYRSVVESKFSFTCRPCKAPEVSCPAHRVGSGSKYHATAESEYAHLTCRLKCDRKDPCSNCVARDAECIYAPLPRGRSAGQTREANSELQGRLRRLEQLVNNVVAQSPSSQQPTSTRGRSVGNVGDDGSTNGSSEPLESIHSSGSEGSQIQPGRVILNNKETIYVSGDHWASVCNEVPVSDFLYAIMWS